MTNCLKIPIWKLHSTLQLWIFGLALLLSFLPSSFYGSAEKEDALGRERTSEKLRHGIIGNKHYRFTSGILRASQGARVSEKVAVI